jgi:hypothetical protein
MQNQVLFPLHEEMDFMSAIQKTKYHRSHSVFTCRADAFRRIESLLAVQIEVEVEDVNS